MSENLSIRPYRRGDNDAIWGILRPIIRAGATYALPKDADRVSVLSYWLSEQHEVFVASCKTEIRGTYYLRRNHAGGGSHVANCGYAVMPTAEGSGVGARLCSHSLETAKNRGFTAMQFNFVVSTNVRAVRLWERHGFQIVGCVPNAFQRTTRDYVDVYIMYRRL